MDIKILHSVMEVHAESGYWILELEVDGVRMSHLMPVATIQNHMAEYGMTQEEALRFVLTDPYTANQPQGKDLFTAPTVAEAKANVLEIATATIAGEVGTPPPAGTIPGSALIKECSSEQCPLEFVYRNSPIGSKAYRAVQERVKEARDGRN